MRQGYIFINNNIFPTLLAISAEEQQQGLMYVEPPAPVMSFIHSHPQINKIWMKSTPSPLDILFCHAGKISEICVGEPFSTRIIGSNLLSDLVVELPYGTVDSTKIKIGQSVGLVKPTFTELKKIISSLRY